ncbi:MAG: carboxymuconolactone decarboxylase family protein [Planctomycetota bacterium]|jgi:4-carboxymuconolactone decarboxylase
MDKKTEEMIALGVVYGINCIFCMEYHKKEAIEAGLTEEEMRAAIGVAKMVKTGAAKKTDASAKKLFGEITDERCCPAGGSC